MPLMRCQSEIDDFINNFCKNCGSCCRQLTMQDKIEISISFGITIWEDICPYSTKEGCSEYENRAVVCRRWSCGVVEKLKDFFKTICP